MLQSKVTATTIPQNAHEDRYLEDLHEVIGAAEDDTEDDTDETLDATDDDIDEAIDAALDAAEEADESKDDRDEACDELPALAADDAADDKEDADSDAELADPEASEMMLDAALVAELTTDETALAAEETPELATDV